MPAINFPTPEEDLALLLSISNEAGQIALSYFGKNPKTWLKEGASPVTEADFAVDAFLKEKLLKARPDYGWISEETQDTRPKKTRQRSFIVDPIDGTRGFIDGRKDWCVSIAIIENETTIAGVLECPVIKETYAAYKNGGATCNGEIIQCSNRKDIKDWVISAKTNYMTQLQHSFAHKINSYRFLPSLAYRLACVATGKIDIVIVRPNCNDWDIAAADLILKEAGGVLITQTDRFVSYGKYPYQHGLLIGTQKLARNDMLNIVHTHKLG